ncbi:MAG: hypothetical protein DLM59_05200 [Pseudonocardiales bacterium]|nr:MAG: hypothetical protein DLM59_05200 [Pseudonocardiales bacterium]
MLAVALRCIALRCIAGLDLGGRLLRVARGRPVPGCCGVPRRVGRPRSGRVARGRGHVRAVVAVVAWHLGRMFGHVSPSWVVFRSA